MKKRIMSAVLAAIMVFGMGTAALASGTTNTQDSINNIPGEGIIGSKPVDPELVLNLTIPTNFKWIVSKDSNTVTSAQYSLVNNSPTCNVEVALTSFKETSTAMAWDRDKLTLNLTDNLQRSDIVGFEGTDKFTGSITNDSAWTFGFDGSYTGTVDESTQINPTYTMILRFTAVK